ncbi:MAG: spermidine/putrescine ABC transporter substrate-binding protein [Actinomycetota bacterium]
MANEHLDPALIRGLTQPRLSRRDVLKYAGLGVGAISLSSVLAACGVSGAPKATGQSEKDWSAFWSSQKTHGEFNFANWPYYIDTKKGTHPTLDQFKADTDITVNYKPSVQGNASFFATLRPSLQAGQDTGWDLFVITNGAELTRLIEFGWLTPLDHTRMPNFTKYASDLVKDPVYDPGNKYTAAWQSGFTGIVVNRKYVHQDITSYGDLWNPDFKGKVGMMDDNTEIGSISLLLDGVDPVTSTPADWTKAAARLQDQKDAGLVRNYYDQSYISAIENGDTWIGLGWSGDVFQATQIGYPELEFIVPDEGIMFWTDAMMIPLGAKNPLDAMTYVDYVFQPEVAAEIADWVWYVTPVPEAQPIILNELKDPTVAKSTLVFPDAAFQAQSHGYYTYKNFDDEKLWNDTFQPIIG